MTTLFHGWSWDAPDHWTKISTIDTHTGGEPLRIITAGLPALEGETVLEKRRYFMDNLDSLRTGLLREPRGHADMYGAILTPAADEADFDVFFLNTVGYSPMCGHAILAITKVVIETGLLPPPGAGKQLVMNTPAGRNYAKASVVDGCVADSSFENVPSFVYLRGSTVDVPGLGSVSFDLSFGGAFYAIVEAESVSVELREADFNTLIDYGRRIKRAIMESMTITHPFEDDLSSLFGVIFTGAAHDPTNHSRNVTVYEDGQVDRSPTGTGISARAALHFVRGELGLNESISIESITGSTMSVRPVKETRFGEFDAIVPEISGTAQIMSKSEFLFAPDDPLKEGFIIR